MGDLIEEAEKYLAGDTNNIYLEPASEELIRALVDRLKAADEVVGMAEMLASTCKYPSAFGKGELAYINDGLIKALVKYNGEGDD